MIVFYLMRGRPLNGGREPDTELYNEPEAEAVPQRGDTVVLGAADVPQIFLVEQVVWVPRRMVQVFLRSPSVVRATGGADGNGQPQAA